MPGRRVLFITRKYPPVRGGMEQYSQGLFNAWASREDVTLLANPLGNKALHRFFLTALAQVLAIGAHFDLIYLGDGVLAALIPVIRARTRARIGITVHGLDITYNRYGFRHVFPRLVARADKVVCVSTYTQRVVTGLGIPASKVIVIPNGIDVRRLPRNEAHTKVSIETKYGMRLGGDVLVSVGRLVKRKGHEWFVREYMPRLPEKYQYVIAGDGPERSAIQAATQALNLAERVRVVGPIEEGEKAFWLQYARGCVMPNVPVANDPEGFGISVLEAIAYGVPVFTTGIEGIADQMQYCHPLDRLFCEPLPRPGAEETAGLRDRIDWSRVVDHYIANV